jgi:hypothetical protein
MGMVCGTTRNGKLIFELTIVEVASSVHPRHHEYTNEDMFDAYAVFTYLTAKHVGSSSSGDHYADLYEYHSRYFKDQMDQSECYHLMAQQVGVSSVFDVIRFGERMVWPGYRKI